MRGLGILRAKTLEGEWQEYELSEVGSVFKDDDVIYFADTPCYLSSVVSVTQETLQSDIDEWKQNAEQLHQCLCAFMDYAPKNIWGQCYDPISAIIAHKELEEREDTDA